jgi:hypothetical protein
MTEQIEHRKMSDEDEARLTDILQGLIKFIESGEIRSCTISYTRENGSTESIFGGVVNTALLGEAYIQCQRIGWFLGDNTDYKKYVDDRAN